MTEGDALAMTIDCVKISSLMELSFLGKNSFRFKTKTLTLIVDPVNAKERADVVVYTTSQTAHAGGQAGGVNREKVFVIDKEGEYELGGVGIVVDKSDDDGTMLVRITSDGVTVADVAALTKKLEGKLAEKVQETDVLLTSLRNASEMIAVAEPNIAVLAGYDDLSEVETYLGNQKFETVKRGMEKIKLEAGLLPENTEIVVLNA